MDAAGEPERGAGASAHTTLARSDAFLARPDSRPQGRWGHETHIHEAQTMSIEPPTPSACSQWRNRTRHA